MGLLRPHRLPAGAALVALHAIRGGAAARPRSAPQGRRGARLARPRHRGTGGRGGGGSALRLRAPH
eukprot:619797-Pleurochrysis_carterae.AAC.1